jgi:hypothetical protein
MVITRIGPMSCAKIAGTLYAAMGLVIGCVISLAAVAGGFGSNGAEGAMGALVGVGAIFILPILYGGLGFVAALVGVWLYNVLAGVVGGIEMDVR